MACETVVDGSFVAALEFAVASAAVPAAEAFACASEIEVAAGFE